MKKCGIIYLIEKENRYLLVCGHKSEKWGFPKGHMEMGETEEQTALREFFEETGIRIQTSMLRDKIRFRNNVYFLVHGERLDLNIQDTREIKNANWFTFSEMIQKIPWDSMNFGLKSWVNNHMMYEKKCYIF